jgi:hypothetical protein
MISNRKAVPCYAGRDAMDHLVTGRESVSAKRRRKWWCWQDTRSLFPFGSWMQNCEPADKPPLSLVPRTVTLVTPNITPVVEPETGLPGRSRNLPCVWRVGVGRRAPVGPVPE